LNPWPRPRRRDYVPPSKWSADNAANIIKETLKERADATEKLELKERADATEKLEKLEALQLFKYANAMATGNK
jgi:hypothetical protein